MPSLRPVPTRPKHALGCVHSLLGLKVHVVIPGLKRPGTLLFCI